MRALLIFGLVFLPLLSWCQTPFSYKKDYAKIVARTQDPKDAWYYETLLEHFQRPDTNLADVDVLALMIGYTALPSYKPYGDDSHVHQFAKLNQAGQAAAASDSLDAFLKTHPLCLEAILTKVDICYEMKRESEFVKYRWQALAVMKAMLSTGSGKTASEAMFSVGPVDGANIVRMMLDGKIVSAGSGEDRDGNFIDIETAEMPDGKKQTYYFNVQPASLSMMRSFGDLKESKKGK